MNYKFISIFLIFIFLASSIGSVVADEDKSYGIESGEIFLDVLDNGLLKVNESYTYNFNGEYNGVYRDIPLKDGQSIENITASADGAYCRLENTTEDGTLKLKLYLYEDSEMTQPVSDKTVVVHYSYDFKNAVKIYNDVGELQYKLWGEDWDVGVDNLNAHIHFPQDSQLEYWINPGYLSYSSSWDSNTLNIDVSDIVSSGEYVELRAIIPLSEFSNPVNAEKINQNGYDEIVKTQEDYENSINFELQAFSLITIVLVVSLAYPIFVYVKYGREPKVEQNFLYFHEPPADEDPMFVDAMFSTKSDIGDVTDNGIQATIMDLINEGVIKLADKNPSKETLRLILPENTQDLDFFEQDIINLFRQFEYDGVVDLDNLNKTSFELEEFSSKLSQLKLDYEAEEVMPYLSNYFDESGDERFKIYGIALIVLSAILLIFSFISENPNTSVFIFVSVFFIIVGVLFFFAPNRLGGRWTQKGMEEFQEWDAFRKFLNDFSLLKEHPPESIAIWNKYLVYATAFGDAKTVSKAMKSIDSSYYDSDDLLYYHSFGGPIILGSVFHEANEHFSDFDDIGDIGEGSGGGGGGAF